MTATEILAQCSALGVRLQPAGDGLEIDAPSGALTPDILAGLRDRKAELLAMLRPVSYPAWPKEIMAACRAASVRWEHDHGDGPQDNALDFGPDGWPVGSVEPQDCPTCPGLLTWQDVGGRWHCERCDGERLARSVRLADAATQARQRWPVKPTARAAPGRGPTALPDSQHLDSPRP